MIISPRAKPRQLSKSGVKSALLKTNDLPHYGVTNINKPNRLRVVFDAAATYSGTSLNQNLLKGPDFLSCLIGVLMRFREGQFAINHVGYRRHVSPSKGFERRF